MKPLVCAFNLEKALVGAYSVIVLRDCGFIFYRVGAAPGEVVAGGSARVLRVVPGAPLRTRGPGHVRLQRHPQSGLAAT